MADFIGSRISAYNKMNPDQQRRRREELQSRAAKDAKAKQVLDAINKQGKSKKQNDIGSQVMNFLGDVAKSVNNKNYGKIDLGGGDKKEEIKTRAKKFDSNTMNFLKDAGSGIQQAGAGVADKAVMGGAVLEDTAAAIRGDSQDERNQIYQRYENVRNSIKGGKTITGESLNPQEDFQWTGDLGRDTANLAGRGLQTGLDATMFINPARMATGKAIVKPNLSQAAKFAGRDAAFFGGGQGAATGLETYGQTGDVGKSIEEGVKAGTISAATQGVLDLGGYGLNRSVGKVVKDTKAIKDANIDKAMSSPKVQSEIRSKVSAALNKNAEFLETNKAINRLSSSGQVGKKVQESYKSLLEDRDRIAQEVTDRITNQVHKDVSSGVAQRGSISFGKRDDGVLEEVNIQKLVDATTPQNIKKEITGKVDPANLDVTAQAISKTKDPNVIQNIVDKQSMKPPVARISDNLVDPAGMNKAVPPPEVQAAIDGQSTMARQAPPTAEAMPPRASTNTTSNKLLSEAKKYNSAEEFVNAVRSKSPDGNDMSRLPFAGDKQRLTKFYNESASNTPKAAPKELADATVPVKPKSDVDDAKSLIMDALIGRKAENGQSRIASAKNLRGKQDRLYKATRAERAFAGKDASKGLSGTEAYAARLGKLKGDMQKVKYHGIGNDYTPQQKEELFTKLQKHLYDKDPEFYNGIRTEGALRKVIFGENGVPTKSEIKLLEQHYGPDFAQSISKDVAERARALNSLNTVGDIAGIPRAILSSGDVSGMGRQALVAFLSHPRTVIKTFPKQFKYFASEKAFKASQDELMSRPKFDMAKSSGLALQELSGPVSETEEKFMSNLAERIPVLGKMIHSSGRAYTGTLNRIRMDLFDQLTDQARKSGYDINDPKILKDLTKVINNSTGRGHLGAAEDHAQSLSTALFAPRLMASRINIFNPNYYRKLSPPAKKEAIRQFVALGTFAASVLGMAKMAGAEVETDPTSSDFAKIKIGDTRLDILGGHQQYLVLAARLAMNKVTSSQTGKEIKLGDEYGAPTAMDIIYRFLESKENPTLGMITKIIKGKDIEGNSTRTAEGIGKTLIGGLTPLIAQDLYDVMQHPKALHPAINTSLSAIGIGSQTYGTQDISLTDKQKKYLKTIEKEGKSAKEIEANTRFFQTLKEGPDRDKALEEIKSAGSEERAYKIADKYNKEYSESFKQWRKEYGKYKNDVLLEQYGKKLITENTIGRYY